MLRYLVEKVDQILRSSVEAEVLSESDAQQVVKLYDQSVKSGRVKDPSGTAVERLKKAWAQSNNALQPTRQSLVVRS